ncbi:MAG TPA: type II secretion system protein [Candidatus Paceibacterota bacterium]|nr:type II secretion system protein [Candidatus Paceibacterota bacterium]
MRTLRTNGFTLAELIVVAAIVSLLAVVSLAVLSNLSSASALRAGSGEVYRALLSARASTLASNGDTVYGVHLTTTSVTRFTGTAYVPGAASNQVYTFERDVNATGTLAISGADIVFERLTGTPSASGTVYVRSGSGNGTSTIIIEGSGLIELQ